MINADSGIYKTDSLEFRGTVGRTYVLHISANDGKEYESEPCLMYPVPEIESVYFEKDQQLTNNATQSLDGISIYLDSKDAYNNQYFRWSYEETWKYRVPYPKKFNYVKGANPDFPHIVPVNDVKEFCWNNRRSGEILIRSISNGQAEKIKKQPVYFIPTSAQRCRWIAVFGLQYLLLPQNPLSNCHSERSEEPSFASSPKAISYLLSDSIDNKSLSTKC